MFDLAADGLAEAVVLGDDPDAERWRAEYLYSRAATIYGGSATYQREEGTDFAAMEQGEIAVTPLHFDLTDIDGMDLLERLSLADLLERDPAVTGQ